MLRFLGSNKEEKVMSCEMLTWVDMGGLIALLDSMGGAWPFLVGVICLSNSVNERIN